MRTTFQPWVEKYRPDSFEQIVLDKLNRTILTNIIEKNYLPNLLFYGPPGTGKTTTIINLSKKIHERQQVDSAPLVIHLNASDERGIDTVRNQINQFVNSSTLFAKGTKIVILDEVDYMTKSAQQALKCLIDFLPSDVRFCLICNYIHRIDESIRDTFLRLRFNQLPTNSIIDFLRKIARQENIPISEKTLASIQRKHQSDIRSMVNHMQSNQAHGDCASTTTDQVWNRLLGVATHPSALSHVFEIEHTFSIGIFTLIKLFAGFIIRHRAEDHEFLSAVQFVMHHPAADETYARNYFVHRILQISEKLNLNTSPHEKTQQT